MTLRLNGSTSGYTQIDAAAVAGDNSITLPTIGGAITIKDNSGNTEVGTGVTFNNPSANVLTISNSGGERLRINSSGSIGIGSGTESTGSFNTVEMYVGATDENYSVIRGKYNRSNEYNRSEVRFGVESNASGLGFLAFATGNNSATERLRIDSNGSAQFQGSDAPSGRDTRISKYGSLLVASTGELLANARCSIDAGNGNIATEGALAAASVNLQSSSTSSWFQTGTSLASTAYVWAAKNSSTNVWHSGLQTDGDLYLGGDLTSSNNIGLNGSSGSAFFKSTLTVNHSNNAGSDQLLRLGNANNTGNNSAHLFLAQGYYLSPTNVDGTGAAFHIDANGIIQTNIQSAGNIQLNSTASFGGQNKVVLSASDGSATFSNGAAEFAATGNLSINRTSGTNDILNGRLNGTVTSTINADGSIFSGGDAGAGANDGSVMNGGSGFSASYSNGSSLIYRGYTTGSSTPTFSVSCAGAIAKASSSFKIPHPLVGLSTSHYLVHSIIEGPQADLIYRGVVDLVDGTATVNIDTAGRMTEGTFVALCTNVSCFTSNESDWTAVKGSITGNVLTITAQDNTSTATVSWMVVGERKDPHMIDTDWTDDAGRVITEPLMS